MKKKKNITEKLLLILILLLLSLGCKKKGCTDPIAINYNENAKNDDGTCEYLYTTYEPIFDIDGNKYNTIKIGNQIWMANNLRVSKYNNGDPIPNVSNGIEWSNLNTGAWVFYNNDSLYQNPFGKLYNWYAVNDSRNICPTGWHVPSDSEWNQLIINLEGGNSGIGDKMKSTGNEYWQQSASISTNASNSSGFSGLPGGNFQDVGIFSNITTNGYWWSSTEVDSLSSIGAWFRNLNSDSDDLYRNFANRKEGLSVRCIKD